MISAIFLGLGWGLVNFWLLKKICESFLIEKNQLKTFLGLLIKVPLLYFLGFGLLLEWPVLGLLSGFGLSLILGGGYVFARN